MLVLQSRNSPIHRYHHTTTSQTPVKVTTNPFLNKRGRGESHIFQQ